MTYVRLLLRLLLPDHQREALLGDLEEDFHANVTKHGLRRASARYRRESMLAILHARRAELVAIASALTATAAALFLGIQGKLTIVVYAAMMVVIAIALRIFRVEGMGRRFAIAFAGFTLAMTSLLACIAVVVNDNASVVELFASAGLILALGAAFALPVAVLTSERMFVAFPLILVPIVAYSALVATSGLPERLRILIPFGTLVAPRGMGWWFSLADLFLWFGIALVARAIARRFRTLSEG